MPVARRTPEEAAGRALSDTTPAVLVPKLDRVREASVDGSEVSAGDIEWGMMLAAVWKLPEDSLPGRAAEGGLRKEFERGEDPWLKEILAGASANT